MDNTDISELDELLDPLAEYEQLFRTVFERSDEGILVSEPDPHGSIIEANQAAAEMHGYTVQEFVRLRTSDLHAIESIEIARRGIEQMLEGGWVEVEHEHVKKDGSKLPVRYRAGVTQYLGRHVIISFVRDITVERDLQEALRQCERELAGHI